MLQTGVFFGWYVVIIGTLLETLTIIIGYELTQILRALWLVKNVKDLCSYHNGRAFTSDF